MKEIIIRTQSELDALPDSFTEFTTIKIVDTKGIRIVVAKAWGNSNVEAWENSNVEAWGNSNVVAWGNVSTRSMSEDCTIELFGFAIAILVVKCRKLIRRSKTTTIVKIPAAKNGEKAWLNREGVELKGGKAILFKRVSSEFKTQENTPNETAWTLGETLVHPDWKPTKAECGVGKFHACSRPYFCDQFRSNKGDRYLAIEIDCKELYAWPNAEYPHKIAFRTGKVLYLCNKFGKRI